MGSGIRAGSESRMSSGVVEGTRIRGPRDNLLKLVWGKVLL